jgi:hypothetical protein
MLTNSDDYWFPTFGGATGPVSKRERSLDSATFAGSGAGP